MSELNGFPPLWENHAGGNIQLQYNYPVMVLCPPPAPLLYNPYVVPPATYTFLPNGMYYFPTQWIPMCPPIPPGNSVMPITAPPQFTQQIERTTNTPRYTMNSMENVIRIGPVTLYPHYVSFNWHGQDVIFLQNQQTPWQGFNHPGNEMQLYAHPRANIQEIGQSPPHVPINNGYASTVALHRHQQDLVNSAQNRPIQNFNQVQTYPPNRQQNWNTPIAETYERRNAPMMRPIERRNGQRQNAPPARRINEVKPPPYRFGSKRHDNNNAGVQYPKIRQETSQNINRAVQPAKIPQMIKENTNDDLTATSSSDANATAFNKLVEDFALSVDQETINKFLTRKVSAFQGKHFQKDYQLVPYVRKTENRISIPDEINFPPNPNAFDFSAYREFLDNQYYQNIRERNYQMQLHRTRVLKRTLVALDQDEQRLRNYLKQETPFYFHLIAVADNNTQMVMRKHIKKFEYKRMLYKSVLRTRDACEKILQEQIKCLMENDNYQIENIQINRRIRQNPLFII